MIVRKSVLQTIIICMLIWLISIRIQKECNVRVGTYAPTVQVTIAKKYENLLHLHLQAVFCKLVLAYNIIDYLLQLLNVHR